MSVHCGPSDGLGALHGRCLCYVTPADRKVPPWRREGPSKRQRDPSRAPLGGLRCTRTPPSALALAREPSDAPHPRPHQPNPSPEFETANTADITRDLVRADTQLHSHLATRGDYHPRQIPGTPPSLAYLPRTATPRDATSATPQHRQARFTPRRAGKIHATTAPHPHRLDRPALGEGG